MRVPLRAARSVSVIHPKTITVHRTATSSVRAKYLVGGLVAALLLPAAGVANSSPTPPPPAPCSNVTAPPSPVDTSEVPPPGVPSPNPLPVPDQPIGGELLRSCELIIPSGVAPPPEEVSAPSWIVADIDTGEVVAAKDPHGRQRPASTIKVLTALVALRELKMEDRITATQADADQEGSRVGLAPGVTYTVRQVLTGLLLQSGNDAAHALAMRMGGLEATVEKMNALASKLGALDTRAATPSGLDGPGMSTSTYDLALIFQRAMRNPDFAQAIATRQITIPAKPGEPPMIVSNDNRVMLNYPGALGGKTGFTNDSRHTFLAAAERNGRRLVTVLLRGENQPIRLSSQSMRLLDYGFGLGRTPPIGMLGLPPKPDPSTTHGRAEHQASAPLNAGASSNMFGTVGGPLTLLAVAGVLLLGVLGVRKRRASLAAAARRNSAKLDDRP